MLLTAGNRLSRKQLDRLDRVLTADDPTGEIGAAWGCKELLRQLLAEHDPTRIRRALWRFYTACAEVNMVETSRLATTIETWWPAILVALTENVTNARTEGFQNRQASQTGRLRVREHGQLPKAHHGPHRSHPTATTDGMTRPPRQSAENRITFPIYGSPNRRPRRPRQ